MFLRGDADQSRLSGRWEKGVIVKAGVVLQDPFRDDVITLFSRESFVEATRHFDNLTRHHLTLLNYFHSLEGIDPSLCDCIYSPAKRRGPVPGRSGQVRKAEEALDWDMVSGGGQPLGGTVNYGTGSSIMQQPQQVLSGVDDMALRQLMLAQQAQSQNAISLQTGLDQSGWGGGSMFEGASAGSRIGMQQQALQHQLNLLTQLQSQQMQLGQNVDVEHQSQTEQPAAQRVRMDPSMETSGARRPDTISAHLHLLSKDDIDGNRLRSYYMLSVDELYSLPVVPTVEKYCTDLNIPAPSLLPKGLQNALMAARFIEVALGALVHDEIPLAMELCNATVHCLRECVQEPVDQSYLFEVARSYFLLGVFRTFRGDLERYLKYRRVCLTHLSQLQDDVSDAPVNGCEALLAAISFLDAWAYMMHNANEKAMPNIDDTIPPVVQSMNMPSTETETKYDVKTAPACIAADPKNQVWIQGAPPVYLNNEAPLTARSLDALSCAIRSCCDQANTRFDSLGKEPEASGDTFASAGMCGMTPTSIAVLSHENELCSRNMVLSAFTLLQQHEASILGSRKNQGHHLIVSAMDAFLENGDEDGSGGFTDSQIQSLLNVCNTVIENPLLLFHGGPTYHMVSNAAILLCHLLNGMYAMRGPQSSNQDMETTVFEEIFDTFTSVRKLLNIHRRKLPVRLRCHAIPRPSVLGPAPDKAFIDLGETLMCACRGCQGFVLMACSPCVAAERARASSNKRDMEAAREAELEDFETFDKEIMDMGAEFDLDDDVLLNMLSRIITA